MPILGMSQGNIATGSWRNHLSFYNSKYLTSSEGYIYSASEDNFFRFDINAFENLVLTKEQGFSGLGISTMKYNPSNDYVVIGFENGYINLIESDQDVSELADIVESESIIGSKSINHIHHSGRFSFLSCDFGVVKLDPEEKEIPEDYRNLAGIQNNAYYCSAVFSEKDSIYVGSGSGLLSARFDDFTNLQDAQNWSLVDWLPDSVEVRFMTSFEGSLYFASNTAGRATLYRYRDSLEVISEYFGFNAKQLNLQQNKLAYVVGSMIEIWQGGEMIEMIENEDFPNPQAFALDPSENNWIGNFNLGLLSNIEGDYRNYSPEGPFSNRAQKAVFTKDRMTITGGSFRPDNYKEGSLETGFFEFKDGNWTNFNPNQTPNTEPIPIFLKDVVNTVYDNRTGTYYYSSNGYGLLVRRPDDSWFLYDETNSPLVNQGASINFKATRVIDAQLDNQGDLWVSNPLVQPSLHTLRNDGTWTSYTLQDNTNGEMLMDGAGNKWLRLSPNRSDAGGVIVFNESDVNFPRGRILNNNPGSGGLPNKRVNAIALDKSGDVWVGTDDGVAVFFNPESVLTTQTVNASTPIFDQRPLLRFEKVTAIAIDGGNRKWIGTTNGVWLFSPDGTEVIENFRERNSPLPSDNIVHIGIHPSTGEVFFITEVGIVSYRGTATEATDQGCDMKIFPNPVEPGYQGLVTISGLGENSIVKITDPNGRLFYEVIANGGTAVWDGRDYNGERPASGVLVVLASEPDGSNSCTGKIAFMNDD